MNWWHGTNSLALVRFTSYFCLKKRADIGVTVLSYYSRFNSPVFFGHSAAPGSDAMIRARPATYTLRLRHLHRNADNGSGRLVEIIVGRVFNLLLCASIGGGTGADSGSADGVETLNVGDTLHRAVAGGGVGLNQLQRDIAR